MELFNFFSSPTAQTTPIKENDNNISSNRPKRSSPTLHVSSASSSRQLGPLFARMHDVYEKKIAADLRTPESVKSITGRTRIASSIDGGIFSPMSCSPMATEDSGRKTIFSAMRPKAGMNTDAKVEMTRPQGMTANPSSASASKASQYALFLKKNPPLVVSDIGNNISPRSVGSDEGSTCWGSIGSNEQTPVPPTTQTAISPTIGDNIHSQKPTLVAFTDPVVSSMRSIASPSSVDFSMDSDSSPRSVNSTTSEDSTGSLLSMNTLRNTAINAMTSGAPSQHIVHPNDHHPSSSSSFAATTSSTTINHHFSTMSTTQYNNTTTPSGESGVRWESQLNALFDAAAGGGDVGMMSNPIDLSTSGGMSSSPWVMSPSPLVSPLASPEGLTSPSSRLQQQQQQHDGFRNGSNDITRESSESLSSICHRLNEQQTRSKGGDEGDDDVDDVDFHHHNQLLSQTTAPSSSSPSAAAAAASAAAALQQTSHGLASFIRTNPPNSTDATTISNNNNNNNNSSRSSNTDVATSINSSHSTVISTGVPAIKRRKKNNASSKSSECLPLKVTVALMILFLGIFLFSYNYVKFMYGWTWWPEDNDDVGIKKDDIASRTNNFDDFVAPLPSIGIVGGIVKGVLKNVLLNDDSSTPYMTPMIPRNEKIQQSNQEKSSHRRFSFGLLKHWIHQVLLRFDGHKNRHKVAKNLSATPILLDNFANSGQQGAAFDHPHIFQAQVSKIKQWLTRCWNQRHGAGCQW